MYICSVSSRLLLYDANGWDLKKCYGCYDGLLRDVSWSDDGKYILQVNSKGIVEILTAADHDVRSLQHIPVKDSWSATFHREGHRHVAIGTKNGNIMVWDTRNKCITKTFPTPSQQSSVNFVSYNSKNTSLAATMQNGDTIIYGLTANIPIETVKLPYSKSIGAMKFHHDARSILGLATDEGHVTLQDILTNNEIVLFENSHNSIVSDIAYSLINRDVMFSCGYDKITNVYDVRLNNIVTKINTKHILTSLGINHENQIALGTKDGLILVYDLRNCTTVFKVLRGHEQEVTRVAFQPQRKKIQAVDVSLQEDAETYMSPAKGCSPVRNRNSDLFYISDTPPTISLNSPPENKVEDSFLSMMSLDKSIIDNNEGNRVSVKSERKSELNNGRFSQSEVEKNNCKVSTPMASKPNVNSTMPSPLVLNGMPDDGRLSNAIDPYVNLNQNGNSTNDAKIIEDLKDTITLKIADLADDNRNYFLHIMMMLTKQKLYLDRTLSAMTQQINELNQHHNTIMDEQRRLILEMDQLKSRHALF